MKKESVPGPNGYEIVAQNTVNGEKKVVIVCHGFGTSQASPTVQALHQVLPRYGMGVYSFDFPAHGESPSKPEGLRVPYCLSDLAAVEERVHTLAPDAQVYFFGSSFGAYIILLYLTQFPRSGCKAFLRSAAVTMPKLAVSWLNRHKEDQLDQRGYFLPDHDYAREMRIAKAFLQDLGENNVFQCWTAGSAELFMIHGERDVVVPPEDPRRFAKEFGAKLVMVPEGEHNLMGPGELDRVLDCAVGFFLRTDPKFQGVEE